MMMMQKMMEKVAQKMKHLMTVLIKRIVVQATKNQV